jgi:hypothetical protein
LLSIPCSDVTKWVLADWIEVRLIFGGERSISLAQLLDELDEDAALPDLAVYDETVSDLSDADEASVRSAIRGESAESGSVESLLADETISELESRVDFIGDCYPIEVVGTVARLRVPTWRDEPVYAFMAALNLRYLWRIPGNTLVGARVFERLTVPALATYWGGRAAHFGWPRVNSEEPGFRQALPRLAATMRERLNIRPDELGAHHKDLAVDAVAWRPLDDRPGQTVLLCQCSIGDDWAEKGVPLEKWMTLMNFAVAPTRGLAFPFVPDAVRALSDVDWLLLCAGVGVPFDRLRMAHLLCGVKLDDDLVVDMINWTDALVANLPDAPAAQVPPT